MSLASKITNFARATAVPVSFILSSSTKLVKAGDRELFSKQEEEFTSFPPLVKSEKARCNV